MMRRMRWMGLAVPWIGPLFLAALPARGQADLAGVIKTSGG
jgi:hypothetical protein